jgi:tetratricopeptide (TPR) repeat protein
MSSQKHSCEQCDSNEAPLRCSRCKNAWYCNRDCQRSAWKSHKPACKPVKAAEPTTPANGSSAEACYKAGDAFEDDGDYDKAEAAYRRAIIADPDHADAHSSLAGLLMAVRANYPGAIESYRRAVAIKPDMLAVYGNLSGMLAMAGDFVGAEEAARCLIRLSPPGDPEGAECLAKVLEEREKATDVMYSKFA